MPNDHDDPAIEWQDDATTTVDHPPVPEADTAKFRSLDYAAGRECGFSWGVEAAGRALVEVLVKAGFTQAEARRWKVRVELAARERG